MDTTSATVSPEARQLFWQIADRADKKTLCLSLEEALVVSIERKQRGEDPKAEQEVTELVESGWISYAPEGGWSLIPSSD